MVHLCRCRPLLFVAALARHGSHGDADLACSFAGLPVTACVTAMVIGACHAYTPDMGSVQGEDQSVPKTIMTTPWSSTVVVATVIFCSALLAARVNAQVPVVVSAPDPTKQQR